MNFRLFMSATALAVVHLTTASAVAARETPADRVPLNLPEPSQQADLAGSGGGGGLFRSLIGLAVVVAVIWGLSWVLRQMKAGREGRATGDGLASLATLPLGPNRAVHVVRVGNEVLLLGSAEQQISQLARYDEEAAEKAGLLDLEAAPAPVAAAASSVVDRLRSWTVRK